jgi:hypothetical protein
MASVDRTTSGRFGSAAHLPTSEPSKLVVERVADGRITCLRFTGTVDESFEGTRLGASVSGDLLVLDLGGIKKISSFGIREWVDFVSAAARQVRALIFVECSPKVVDQLNMVANFAGGGRVVSFYAPFRCDYCDSDHRALLQVDRDHDAIAALRLPDRPCPSCGERMYFDEDGSTFFSFVLAQERFALDPEVAAFLASRLDYVVTDQSRKLHVDKLIDGRITYLRLVGDLDRAFPRDKLAEGLEGTVVVDLGELGRMDPPGAAQWRGFVTAATPLIEQLYLAHVAPIFLEKLCSREDLGPKGQVLTLVLPYACGPCAITTGQVVDVAAHHDVLKFATAPELRCPTCKQVMRCVAAEPTMTALPYLARPTASPDVVRSLAVLRDRALAPPARRLAGVATAAPEAPAPARGGSLVVPVLAVLLALALAAAGVLAYRHLTAPDPSVERVTARSAPARPAWLAVDAPGSAQCAAAADGSLTCVGASQLAALRDDADADAADAAYDALAAAIAARITDASWQRAVPVIYTSARAAKLAALARSPALASARRDVREARAAVAAALRSAGGAAVPAAPTGSYWEERTGPDGKRYAAFAQVAIGARGAAQLVAAYALPASALGVTTVPVFPLVAWQFPRVERGAIVTALAPGALAEVGLAARYIVLAIQGRDVIDAISFAAIALEEHAQLATRGGTLRLAVQTADPAPRVFERAIAGQVGAAAPAPRREAAPPRVDPRIPNGINVWDRFGGGKEPARDDPER